MNFSRKVGNEYKKKESKNGRKVFQKKTGSPEKPPENEKNHRK